MSYEPSRVPTESGIRKRSNYSETANSVGANGDGHIHDVEQDAVVGITAQDVGAGRGEADCGGRLAGLTDRGLRRREAHRARVAAIHHPHDAQPHAAIQLDDGLAEWTFDAGIRAALAR